MKSYPKRLNEDLSDYFAKLFPIEGPSDVEYHIAHKLRNDNRKAFDTIVDRQAHRVGLDDFLANLNIRDTELLQIEPELTLEFAELFSRGIASQRGPTVRKGEKGRMLAESLRLVKSQGKVARYAALMPIARRYV
jgi:hypothetical protein